MWKQSALYLSVKTDKDLFDFLALMSQANSADSDEKMQAFYKAVQGYNSDPGHVDDPLKIQECLDLAVEALAVKKVPVEAVERCLHSLRSFRHLTRCLSMLDRRG